MSFEQTLRTARERAGMSQAQLARAAGLTRAVISKWEKGDSINPSAHAVQAAADVLGVTVASLLAERGMAGRDIEQLFHRLGKCSDDIKAIGMRKLGATKRKQLESTLSEMLDDLSVINKLEKARR
jgi:transcriptional regulator with XRE-family HTH domain